MITNFEKPEILSPAGDMDCLKSALNFGADAVFLAGKMFGMRSAPQNFDNDQLKKACDLAHAKGARIHVTCNTLPRNNEIPHLQEFMENAQACGVDAFIIADLGVFEAAKKYAPKVQRHISTQAGVTNYAAANVLYNMGASRVVLAREIPLDEIAEMRAKVPKELEIECFVHGAMCVSFSGRCLISSYMTGRDANHGDCAQPCRWKYHLYEENRQGQYFPVEETGDGTYLYNSRDLCMIEHIPELVKAQAGQGRVGKVLQRRGEREAVALSQGAQGGLVTLEMLALGPGQQGPGIEGKAPVGRDEAGLEIVHGAQAHTAGAGPLRAVEGKELRAGRGQGDVAVRTDRSGRMDDVPFPFGPVGQVDGQAAFAVAQGQLHGIGQAAADAVLVDQAVHHQIDAVLLVLVQGGHVVQRMEGAVHAHAGEAFGTQLLELVLMGAFLQFHQRRHDHELAALGQGHDVGDDLVGGAGLDGAAAGGAVHAAQTGEEDAQKVVDLRHRAHGGAGVARGALLLQRDGRGKALDLLHVRLVHLGQELPGIGRKGFHIAALALGIDDIEGQGGLAGTGGPADHHQLVAGDVQADVLEVVLPGFFDMDAGIVHGLLCKRGDVVWQEGFLISTGKNGPERWTKDREGRIKFLTSRDGVAARGRYACFFLSADAHAAGPVRGPGAGERAHRPRGVRRPAHEYF